MITITRNEVRQLRTVLRRCGIKPLSYANQRVRFSTGSDGLRVQTANIDVAVQYHVPGELPAEELSLPLEFLDACQGRHDAPVTLEPRPKHRVLVSWTDSGVPQQVQYDGKGPGKELPFPDLPQQFTQVSSELWPALGQAKDTTDRESIRYTLGDIQLRGTQGEIVSTDGRQVLVQGGFQFPWADELLIRAPAVLGWSELAQQEPIDLGKTDDGVALRLGRWTIVLRIDKEGRFPNVGEVIPNAESITSRLHLTSSDADFLAQVLPRLPCDDDQHQAITLDLGSQIAVRARPPGEGRTTEVVLSGSQVLGEAVLLNVDRRFLARALKFGFREIGLKDLAAPLVCRDEHRQYAFMPLSPEDAVKATDDAIRIASPVPGTEAATIIPIPKTRKTSQSTMSESTTSTSVPEASASETAASSGPAAAAAQAGSSAVTGTAPKVHQPRSRKSGRPSTAPALEQAIALRDSLRRQAGQAGELVRAIKRQRREAQLVKSTLAQLKQLQAAG